MTQPWGIHWYNCYAIRNGEKKGVKAGDLLWRLPRSIGPIYCDHAHEVGWHIGCSEKEALLAAAAPVTFNACVEAEKVLSKMHEVGMKPEFSMKVHAALKLVRNAIKEAQQ